MALLVLLQCLTPGLSQQPTKHYTPEQIEQMTPAQALDLLVRPDPEYGTFGARQALVAIAKAADDQGRAWIMDQLVALTRDPKAPVGARCQACYTLMDIDVGRGTDEMVVVLARDPTPVVRSAAASALANSDLPAARAALEAAEREEPDATVRDWVTKALARVTQREKARSEPIREDFEAWGTGTQPLGWSPPGATSGYQGAVSDEQPFAGKRCYRITCPSPEALPKNGFGAFSHAVNATLYRGYRVRFSGAVRAVCPGRAARAQLWMRVDRPDKQPGFFDNMDERPITSPTWQTYQVVGDVADDATGIMFGAIIQGGATVGLDDLVFEIVGPAEEQIVEPPRPLAPKAMENLVAFTRLLGYIRHFHPSDRAAATDWADMAIRGMRGVESARNASELCQRLRQGFAVVAPTVRIFPTGQSAALPAELQPPKDARGVSVTYWVHTGFGGGEPGIYRSDSKRVPMPAGEWPADVPRPDQPFAADLGAGISCLVPLALYADAEGTLPHGTGQAPTPRPTVVPQAEQDRATRLADVALAWNVMQHFYPYFDVVKTDWPAALQQALTTAATDPDGMAFLMTLRRMIARLHDGHGNVTWTGDKGRFMLPVRLAWVEDQLVVTDVYAAAADKLRPGDVIVQWDGRPTREVLADLEQTVSGATPGWIHHVSTGRLLMGLQGSEVKLLVQSPGGAPRPVTLQRAEWQPRQWPRPYLVELKPGIMYVDLDRIQTAEFEQAVPQLAAARAIIFDLRGYPDGLSVAPLQHLMEQSFTSAQWHVPVVTYPDHERMSFLDSCNKHEPLAPRFTGKIVFITDGSAISYAETCMGMVEHYKMGAIVGETTAGTNGNICPFTLPGGYRVVWTGMKVLKHDGSQHHGVGIIPTVPVSPTVKGLAEGRDELLERALQLAAQ